MLLHIVDCTPDILHNNKFIPIIDLQRETEAFNFQFCHNSATFCNFEKNSTANCCIFHLSNMLLEYVYKLCRTNLIIRMAS